MSEKKERNTGEFRWQRWVEPVELSGVWDDVERGDSDEPFADQKAAHIWLKNNGTPGSVYRLIKVYDPPVKHEQVNQPKFRLVPYDG